MLLHPPIAPLRMKHTTFGLQVYKHSATCCSDLRNAHPTWVSGGDDGSKEETVGVVKFVSELTHDLHQLHHAVHEVPARWIETKAPGCRSRLQQGGPALVSIPLGPYRP